VAVEIGREPVSGFLETERTIRVLRMRTHLE
jgi:hypothetical protein